MEREGLVTRPDRAPSGRVLPTELTARGREQLRTASAAVRAVEERMLSGLDETRQAQLRDLLARCADALT
jgi:DNA-binding MarR family transcriptional regulator